MTTENAGNGFAELQPLKEIAGDAWVVGLAEATHGTAEFFKTKHRLVEFLAREMSFSIFSIEANMPEAFRMNDYVLTGRGDPKHEFLPALDEACRGVREARFFAATPQSRGFTWRLPGRPELFWRGSWRAFTTTRTVPRWPRRIGRYRMPVWRRWRPL